MELTPARQGNVLHEHGTEMILRSRLMSGALETAKSRIQDSTLFPGTHMYILYRRR